MDQELEGVDTDKIDPIDFHQIELDPLDRIRSILFCELDSDMEI